MCHLGKCLLEKNRKALLEFLIFMNGTWPSGAHQHSAKWYPGLQKVTRQSCLISVRLKWQVKLWHLLFPAVLTLSEKNIIIMTDYNQLWTHYEIKSPQPLRAALDRKCFLITDEHTEVMDCIPCVMVIQTGERPQPSKRTDGCYQTYYLPASRSITRGISWNWLSLGY